MKHLIDILDLSREEIEDLIAVSLDIIGNQGKCKVNAKPNLFELC